MPEFEFRCLNENDESAYRNFISEFTRAGEKIIPRSIYDENLSFRTWLERSRGISSGKSIPDNWVQAATYFLIRKSNGKILGALDLRHKLNEELLRHGGHIGYGVAPSERKKGYASLMLQKALKICKDLDINKALITCDKENIGSAKTIMKHGGVLENEIVDELGRHRQRYWIEIK